MSKREPRKYTVYTEGRWHGGKESDNYAKIYLTISEALRLRDAIYHLLREKACGDKIALVLRDHSDIKKTGRSRYTIQVTEN